ncbi:MAG: TIR domain-containing protein, partial [Gammaproteobacteria bacterium]|nr:TIR domain-containing protein [Gammaproteobacteria bacterium]
GQQDNVPSHAVFLSYASEDAAAAERIATALRAGGIEVWFDKSALRGGDAWDRQIRQQIHDCRLFVPLISAHTEARDEGYFRREWRLAVERAGDMAEKRAFLVPVVIDATSERGASVPDRFREVHWTRLPGGETPTAFVARLAALLGAPAATTGVAGPIHSQPGSVQRTASRPPIALPRWVWPALAALVVVIALAYFGTSRFTHAPAVPSGGRSSSPTKTDGSIAVLPFADMSEKHDQEYLADGLAEEILNLLARIPNLRVIGRTSSFQFKGRNDDLRSIGEKLGAAYVLEGSVRRAGDRVRVTAQLINTRDGVHLWSNTYNRPFGDVLQLQDEIAWEVAHELEVAVRSDTGGARGTSNSEAYDLYLRGLHSVDQFDGEGLAKGANYFQQALDLDPNFADAAAHLGRMQALEADFGLAPVATYERARRSLETAIRLDPSSGLAHAWLGWTYMAYDWDWATASTQMQEALRLAPHDPLVQLGAARLAMALGHWDEAIGLLTAAANSDPLFAALHHNLAEVYLRIDRLSHAEAAERHVLEVNPTYASAPVVLAKILLAQGRAADALEVITAHQQEGSDRPAMLAVICHALGRKADADAQLATLIHRYQGEEAAEIASVFAFRGHADEAFSWLERAYSQRDPWLYFIKVDPLFKNIESDPRYQAFLRKMNLPE